jgi:endoglucanase
MKKLVFLAAAVFLIVFLLQGCSLPKAKKDVLFRRCMNIGNALDSPKDIPWDVEMDVSYFDAIKQAGFDCVRLPVRFSDYAKDEPGYILDEGFMIEIDGYVNYALDLGLVLILDFHHFIELMERPEQYKECFYSVWDQLSERYSDYPSALVYELLNEPCGNLSSGLWNEYLAEAIRIVRKNDAERLILVGPANYNSIDGLGQLALPEDENLMVTFHYYEPTTFTFQGNINHKGYEELQDIEWNRTEDELAFLRKRFDIVADWAEENDVRIFLGEFGANENAPYESRVLWTTAVREEAEMRGFSWGYWELCSAFGIYDTARDSWDESMLGALIGD